MSFHQFFEQYFPFWGKLTQSDKDYLCQNSSLVYFEKEQPVHNNTDCSGLYIVKSGKLRLYMLSEEGKEITLYRLGPGDICMLSASCCCANPYRSIQSKGHSTSCAWLSVGQ